MENLGTAVGAGITTISTVMGDVVELAITNPFIMVFVSAGFVGLGIGMFRKLKKVGK